MLELAKSENLPEQGAAGLERCTKLLITLQAHDPAGVEAAATCIHGADKLDDAGKCLEDAVDFSKLPDRPEEKCDGSWFFAATMGGQGVAPGDYLPAEAKKSKDACEAARSEMLSNGWPGTLGDCVCI